MRTARECGLKAEDLERRALVGPEAARADWREMAAHWRRLEAQAILPKI